MLECLALRVFLRIPHYRSLTVDVQCDGVCMLQPFLHRSHNKNVPRIQQAPVAGVSSRRLQPVNSFTARLGPAAGNSSLAAHFQLQ